MKTDYDVIIIGGGPGGYTSAIYCARSSLKTLIIEETHAGGLHPAMWIIPVSKTA